MKMGGYWELMLKMTGKRTRKGQHAALTRMGKRNFKVMQRAMAQDKLAKNLIRGQQNNIHLSSGGVAAGSEHVLKEGEGIREPIPVGRVGSIRGPEANNYQRRTPA